MRRTAGPIDYLRPWHRLIATPYVDVQREDNTLNAIAELNEQTDRSLLIVEDDKPFLAPGGEIDALREEK